MAVRSLLGEIRACGERREAAILVTVVNVRGSAPREVGAQMLVTAAGIVGTIGGGQLEYSCTRSAVKALKDDDDAAVSWQRTYPLGSRCGQCCGGVVDVQFEWADERNAGLLQRLESLAIERENNAFVVALFGAGHVGSAVVAALANLGCRVHWIDGRNSIFPERVPDNVTCISTTTPAAEVAAMPAGAMYLVMTHSHALDFEICDAVLRREDALYCGLIGSLAKRRRFERLMKKQGMPAAALATLTCPVGVPGIPGKRPAEIAIAVAAELLQIHGSAFQAQRFTENVHVI